MKANNKHEPVVAARAFHPKTGNPAEFQKVILELDFTAMTERESHYEKGGGFMADDIQTLSKENLDNKYTGDVGHHYFSVIK